jgi:hypothetical protein
MLSVLDLAGAGVMKKDKLYDLVRKGFVPPPQKRNLPHDVKATFTPAQAIGISLLAGVMAVQGKVRKAVAQKLIAGMEAVPTDDLVAWIRLERPNPWGIGAKESRNARAAAQWSAGPGDVAMNDPEVWKHFRGRLEVTMRLLRERMTEGTNLAAWLKVPQEEAPRPSAEEVAASTRVAQSAMKAAAATVAATVATSGKRGA